MDRYRIVKVSENPDAFEIERKGLFFWTCAVTEIVCGNTCCRLFNSLEDAAAWIETKRDTERRRSYRPQVVWTE